MNRAYETMCAASSRTLLVSHKVTNCVSLRFSTPLLSTHCQLGMVIWAVEEGDIIAMNAYITLCYEDKSYQNEISEQVELWVGKVRQSLVAYIQTLAFSSSSSSSSSKRDIEVWFVVLYINQRYSSCYPLFISWFIILAWLN